MNAPTPRIGDWMQTYTGRQFWPLDPRAEEVDIEDIAHALSHLCRYGGHCLNFYSVAEHSMLMASKLALAGEPRDVVLWALLHDAAEAYLVDVPRPIKRMLSGYKEIEEKLQLVIAARFQLPIHIPAIVHEADNRILVDEKYQNMASGLPWPGVDNLEPLGVHLHCWAPWRAEEAFLAMANSLGVAP